jgi:hypothetical protein
MSIFTLKNAQSNIHLFYIIIITKIKWHTIHERDYELYS